jgi:hypothetical protein
MKQTRSPNKVLNKLIPLMVREAEYVAARSNSADEVVNQIFPNTSKSASVFYLVAVVIALMIASTGSNIG